MRVRTSSLSRSALKSSALDSSALDYSALNSSAMDSTAMDSSAMDSSALDPSAVGVGVALLVRNCIQRPCRAVPDIQSLREYGNFPNSYLLFTN